MDALEIYKKEIERIKREAKNAKRSIKKIDYKSLVSQKSALTRKLNAGKIAPEKYAKQVEKINTKQAKYKELKKKIEAPKKKFITLKIERKNQFGRKKEVEIKIKKGGETLQKRLKEKTEKLEKIITGGALSVDFFGKDIYFSKYKQLEKLHRGIIENGRENDLWYLAQQIDSIINFVIQEAINDNPTFNAKFTLNIGMFELDITFKNRDEFFEQIIKAVGEKMNAARANKNDKKEQSYADYLQKLINVLQRAKSARTDGLDISSYVIKQKKKKKGKDSGYYSKEYNEFDYDYFKEIDIYEYEIISEIRFS